MHFSDTPTDSILVDELLNRCKDLIDTFDSQSEFSDRTTLPRSTVSALYNQKIQNPSFTLLIRIIEGTHCSERWLMSGQGEMFEKSFKSEEIDKVLNNYSEYLSPHQPKSVYLTKEKLILIKSLIDDVLPIEKIFGKFIIHEDDLS